MENCNDRESYSLASALALGLVMLRVGHLHAWNTGGTSIDTHDTLVLWQLDRLFCLTQKIREQEKVSKVTDIRVTFNSSRVDKNDFGPAILCRLPNKKSEVGKSEVSEVSCVYLYKKGIWNINF